MASKDYFKLLNIHTNASEEEIKKAYFRQARKWHPDKNPGRKELAETNFRLIKEAYDYLSDPKKRVALAQSQRHSSFSSTPFSSSSTHQKSSEVKKNRWSNFQHPSTSSQPTKEEREKEELSKLRTEGSKLLDDINFDSSFDLGKQQGTHKKHHSSSTRNLSKNPKYADLDEYEKMVLESMRNAQARRV